MCELGCMNVAFLVPLDGVFCAAEACPLNHCNKADSSQSFDSSEARLPSFTSARRRHNGNTYEWTTYSLRPVWCLQFKFRFNVNSQSATSSAFLIIHLCLCYSDVGYVGVLWWVVWTWKNKKQMTLSKEWSMFSGDVKEGSVYCPLPQK